MLIGPRNSSIVRSKGITNAITDPFHLKPIACHNPSLSINVGLQMKNGKRGEMSIMMKTLRKRLLITSG